MDAQAKARIAKLEEVLKKVPYQYQNLPRLRSDVSTLLRTCATLQPQLGTFTGTGRQVTLFYLYGVLPISYNGATYNIPVTIYFDAPYPTQPPRCFVTPSQGMALKSGHPHVDAGGMIYIPYLSSWNPQTSTLSELVTYLMSTFSSQPPVYSTAGGSRPAAASAAAPAAASQPDPGANVLQAVGSALGGLFGRPAAEQRPAAAATAQPAAAQSQPAGGYPQAAGQPVATVTATPIPTVTAIPIPRNRKESAVVAATAKLQESWAAALEPLVADVNRQLARQRELEAGAEASGEEVRSLKAEAVRVEEREAELRTAEESLGAFVGANAGREADPDELRDELDADKQQVLDCLAEEQALEEFLVGLDELLAAHKLSTEDFLREVRDVSRRQFMCRALRQKSTVAIAAAAGVAAPAAVAPTAPVASVPAPTAPVASVPVMAAAAPAGGRRQLVAA